MTRYRWEVLSKIEGQKPTVLYELPDASIATPQGAVLPPSVLTMWDDASLMAVGIRRVRLDIEEKEEAEKALSGPAEGYKP